MAILDKLSIRGIEKTLVKFSLSNIFIGLFVLIALGQGINYFVSYNNFTINQTLLIIILILEICEIRGFASSFQCLRAEIEINNEPEVMGLINGKLKQYFTTRKFILIVLFFVILYMSSLIVLNYVTIDYAGIYGIFLASITFSLGILAYSNYLIFIYFMYNLKNLKIENYAKFAPAHTMWFIISANILSYVEKYFFIIGFLYVLTYTLLTPIDSISFADKITINTPHNFMFLTSWIFIIIFFVVAFPLLTIYARLRLKNIVVSCKNRNIKEIEVEIRNLSNNDNHAGIEKISIYLEMMKFIDDSRDYPLKNNRSFADSLFSFSLTTITFLIPLISLALENMDKFTV